MIKYYTLRGKGLDELYRATNYPKGIQFLEGRDWIVSIYKDVPTLKSTKREGYQVKEITEDEALGYMKYIMLEELNQ